MNNKQHRVPRAFLGKWYRARYRMPTKDELMPLAKSPLQHNAGDWVAALLAAARPVRHPGGGARALEPPRLAPVSRIGGRTRGLWGRPRGDCGEPVTRAHGPLNRPGRRPWYAVPRASTTFGGPFPPGWPAKAL
jgi:hypothetical protein